MRTRFVFTDSDAVSEKKGQIQTRVHARALTHQPLSRFEGVVTAVLQRFRRVHWTTLQTAGRY